MPLTKERPSGQALGRALNDSLLAPEGLWERYALGATWAFVALGIMLRLSRYLLCFPLWGDECMVAVSFLERGYAELLRPLDWGQICPLAFLWVELSLVKLLGFSEWSLRLFPLACSIAGLLLFRHVAARLLKGLALVASVGAFSVGYYLIRHGSEVKPYSLDVLAALALIALSVEWLRAPQRPRLLWILAALALGISFTSYPVAFVGGAVSLGLLPAVWARRDRGAWLAWVGYNAALAAGFCIMYVTFGRAHQDAATVAGINVHAAPYFPPTDSVLRLAGWLAGVHTGQGFAYPLGACYGGSVLTSLCFVVGAVTMIRRRTWPVLIFCVAPLPLGLIAAAMHKYPYGFNTRTMLYAAPGICLLAGLGLATAVGWLRSATWRRRASMGVVGGLVMVGLGVLAFDPVHPFKTTYDRELRDFARWFWREQSRDAELVCVAADLKQNLYPECRWLPMSEYHCNRRIYSPRHAQEGEIAWQSLSAAHPLRCVVAGVPGGYPNAEALARWLEGMQADYRLVNRHEYFVNADADERYCRSFSTYDFVPKTGPAAGTSQPPPAIARLPLE